MDVYDGGVALSLFFWLRLLKLIIMLIFLINRFVMDEL